ncbi:MAG TPA: BON domain-containing protein [Terriglobales bacterium]|nr:BON domain-containing protein [Terriglobales bacterium]
MRTKLAVCGLALSLSAFGLQATPPQTTPNTQTVNPTLPPAGNPAAHTALSYDIIQKLSNTPSLSGVTITASVTDDGAVSLNGVVPTQAEADAAVAAVQAVPGVQSVKSQILVDQDPFANSAPASSGATMPSRTTAALENAANDPEAKLAAALAAVPALARVSGTLYGDTLNLIGTVPNKAAKDQASKIAAQVLPQFKRKNIIWVDPHPLAPPPMVPKEQGH